MRSGPRFPLRRRRSAVVAALVALALAVTGTLSTPAGADDISDQEARVQHIADQLDALENRIGQLGEDHAAALDRIEELDVEIAAQQAKISEQEVQLAQLQGQLTSIAIDTFTSGGAAGGLSPIFSSAESFTEDLQRDELARVALIQGTGSSDDLVDLLSTLDDERSVLEAKQQEQADLAAQLEQQQADGEALQIQYQSDYAAAKAELGDLIEQEQERRAEAAAAAAAAAARAAQQASASQSSTASAPRGGGTSSTGGSTSTGGGGTTTGTDSGTSGSSGDSSGSSGGSSAPPPASTAGIAISAAYGQLGVAYKFAAESPGVAFDCSGLTKWAWGQAGVYLPHQSASQYASTPHVDKSEAQPGDLVFYYSPIGHVGLYLGGGQMIHAPATGDVVKIVSVNWNKVVGVSRPG